MLAKKIYWCFTDSSKRIKLSDKKKLEESQTEIKYLKSLLDCHIDTLDEAEAEIQDFIQWSSKSPSTIPSYALGGLKAVIGA